MSYIILKILLPKKINYTKQLDEGIYIDKTF